MCSISKKPRFRQNLFKTLLFGFLFSFVFSFSEPAAAIGAKKCADEFQAQNLDQYFVFPSRYELLRNHNGRSEENISQCGGTCYLESSNQALRQLLASHFNRDVYLNRVERNFSFILMAFTKQLDALNIANMPIEYSWHEKLWHMIRPSSKSPQRSVDDLFIGIDGGFTKNTFESIKLISNSNIGGLRSNTYDVSFETFYMDEKSNSEQLREDYLISVIYKQSSQIANKELRLFAKEQKVFMQQMNELSLQFSALLGHLQFIKSSYLHKAIEDIYLSLEKKDIGNALKNLKKFKSLKSQGLINYDLISLPSANSFTLQKLMTELEQAIHRHEQKLAHFKMTLLSKLSAKISAEISQYAPNSKKMKLELSLQTYSFAKKFDRKTQMQRVMDIIAKELKNESAVLIVLPHPHSKLKKRIRTPKVAVLDDFLPILSHHENLDQSDDLHQMSLVGLIRNKKSKQIEFIEVEGTYNKSGKSHRYLISYDYFVNYLVSFELLYLKNAVPI